MASSKGTQVDPSPTRLEELLDVNWLSTVLGGDDTNARVVAVTLREQTATVASKLRVEVTYDGEATLPNAFCIKVMLGSASEASQVNAINEARFYRDLADVVGIRIPRAYYAGINEKTGTGIVILEDLIDSGCRFRTARVPYTVDEVAGTLEELAKLHAACWDASQILDQRWLQPRTLSLADAISMELLGQQLNDGRFDVLAPIYRDPNRLKAALRSLNSLAANVPATLTHGDTHAGNLYVTANGANGFLDWQVVQRNCWALDVAYHIAGVLTTDDREKSERDLLDHYLDRLGAYGVTNVDAADAWSLYRAHLVYGHYLWAITRFVDRDITEEMCLRLGSAVQYHRSYELLDG